MIHSARPLPRRGSAVAHELEAEALAAPLPPLLAQAERLSSTVGLGVHGRRCAGMGETFWQFRRYAHGDASNTIDWRQSAKSPHVYVREREWEAVQVVWFWCDGSSSMRFASDRSLSTKGDRGRLLALALASLLLRGGEHVGVPGGGPPAGGRHLLHRMARKMTEDGEAGRALPPPISARKAAQLVWFSDFLLPFSEIERTVHDFAAYGLSGHLVQLIDPAEQDFPYSGRTRFEWRTARQPEILGRAESVRERYRKQFDAHTLALRQLAGRQGWTCLAHRTDHRPETALIALYASLGGVSAQRALGV